MSVEEPTVAQVTAALQEFYSEPTGDWSTNHEKRMRRALRAAFAARVHQADRCVSNGPASQHLGR